MTENELVQKFLPIKGLRVVDKIDLPKATIFIAETDHLNDRKDYPMGYYQTAFFVGAKASKGEIDGGIPFEFDAFHDKDKGWTPEAKKMARRNATIKEAKKWVDKNIEMDRY